MNILVSAFACAPEKIGAERGVGLLSVRELSKEHNIWVISDKENKKHIKSLEVYRKENVNFFHLDLFGYRRDNLYFHRLYYVLWKVLEYNIANKIAKEVDIDLVFHVTYANSWIPSCLLGFLEVPFLWYGGGRKKCDLDFIGEMSAAGKAREIARNLGIEVMGSVVNWLTARKADLILSSTSQEVWGTESEVKRFTIGGLSKGTMSSLGEAGLRNEKPFRIASIGRLHGWKGFALSIKAFRALREVHPQSELWVIGDGPEREYLESLSRHVGCSESTTFFGKLSRQETLRRIKEIDVLVHPSLHELFGYVMVESMAAGKPVICLEKEGAPLTVGDAGITIPPTSPEQVVSDIGEALIRLAGDPDARRELSERARERAKYWSEEAMGERLRSVCENIVNDRSSTSE